MGTCATCGNVYDKTFTVTTAGGDQYEFDSIECAAQMLAPTCERCGVRILGHGFEDGDIMYCSAHCARQVGITAFEDSI